MSSVFKEEGYRFIAAAFEVYNVQGFGMAEEVYQECLEIELTARGIPFQTKREIKCFYKGRELKKRYIPDLVVLDRLIVELKAVSSFAPEHEAQLLNYMRITCQPVGYLVNFGQKDILGWKRFILSEFIPNAVCSLPSAKISAD